MSWIVMFAFLTGGAIVVLLAALILVRWSAYRIASDLEHNEMEGFSLARYEPMARLLAEDDFLFLAAQPGFEAEIGARLRRERRRIFRLYLRELARDFGRLHAEAREMVAESEAQHAELVGLLLRQQITFWRALAGVELRLLVGSLGMGKVEIRGLVEAVEKMRVDLARFAAPAPETL